MLLYQTLALTIHGKSIKKSYKSLGSTKSKITNDKNLGITHLGITKVISVDGNIVSNNYQQDSRAFCTFVPNKSFGQLLGISSKKFIYLKTFNSEFSYIEVWFTNKNSKSLEIEVKINITLVIN